MCAVKRKITSIAAVNSSFLRMSGCWTASKTAWSSLGRLAACCLLAASVICRLFRFYLRGPCLWLAGFLLLGIGRGLCAGSSLGGYLRRAYLLRLRRMLLCQLFFRGGLAFEPVDAAAGGLDLLLRGLGEA